MSMHPNYHRLVLYATTKHGFHHLVKILFNLHMNIVEIRIKNLQRLLNDKAGGNQTELGRLIGKRQSYVSDLLAGKKSFGEKVARDIEGGLGLGPGWLDRESKAEPSNVTEGPPIRGRVPLISWVQAGDFTALVDNYATGDGEDWVDSVVPVRRHTFALRVKGDSMVPEFNEGEVVIVEPDADAENGDFVVVRNGDAECTLKQLVRDGAATFLKPINERYPIYPFPVEGVIVGVVKGKVKLY